MRPATVRFWEKVNKDGPIPAHRPELGPCWLWTGALSSKGYGNFWDGQKYTHAHIFADKLEHGEIDPSLERDHLCRTPACVRYSHLEAVTHKVNALRGKSPNAENARKTVCKRGHAFSFANTIVCRYGHRKCRTCQNALKRRLYRLSKEATAR